MLIPLLALGRITSKKGCFLEIQSNLA